jgi:hypothetical protein
MTLSGLEPAAYRLAAQRLNETVPTGSEESVSGQAMLFGGTEAKYRAHAWVVQTGTQFDSLTPD